MDKSIEQMQLNSEGLSENVITSNSKSIDKNINKKSRPGTGINFPKPKNPIVRRPRVIKLNLTNILIGLAIFGILIVFLNNLLQPSRGSEISIGRFIGNIKNNEYSELLVRNDGNAVAYGKNLAVVPTSEIPEDLDLAENYLAQSFKNEGADGEFETKTLDDVISVISEPENFSETISQLRELASRNFSQPERLLILEDKLLLDWDSEDKADWIVTEIDLQDLEEDLEANNLDLESLPIETSILGTDAKVVTAEQFATSFANERYVKAWEFDGNVYALNNPSDVVQNYVSYGSSGTTPAEFISFLQSEDIDFARGNFELSVQQINNIGWDQILGFLLLAGLIGLAAMLVFNINGSNGGLMQFGRSKARMFFGRKMNITFDDVAGVEEAKEQLKEVVDFLKHPKKYQKLGAKIPRGALMVGKPGTGKTLLARAVAGEAGVPFFHTSGSEFEEMLVGAGASRVRDLFDKAKKASPALIFIDEIDAVGRKRGTTVQSSSTEQTLNQILVEMDGFEQRDNVIVIAATNRPDVLDPALLRPGRFDRKVVLDEPDIDGRKKILAIHAANKPLSDKINLEDVAKRTVGFSGADLENMLNEAAIIVAKENRKEITPDDVEEAATKVQTGPVRRRKRSQKELKMTAYHEAAHALVMRFTPESDPVHRITILSRGMALGYTMPLPQSDQLQMTKTKMVSKIAVLLAGYSAEKMIFGDVTTGASNDIERATTIAHNMVKKYGMSDKLGLVRYGSNENDPSMGWGRGDNNYSDETAKLIDDEVRQIVADAQITAQKILDEKSDILDKVADALLEREVLDSDEFEAYVSGKPVDTKSTKKSDKSMKDAHKVESDD